LEAVEVAVGYDDPVGDAAEGAKQTQVVSTAFSPL